MTVRIDPPPSVAVPAHAGWRAVWWSCVLTPVIVLAPLLALPLWADHRLNVYAYGSAYLHQPWRLPVDAVAAVPYFLSVGNFRPLGRTYEWFLDVFVFGLVDYAGIPAHIGLRLVAVAAAILLTFSAVRLAVRVTARGNPLREAPPAVVTLIPYAVGAGLIASGRMSTTVLFSGLYLFTSALVLGVAGWACRAVGEERLTVRRKALALLVGAAVAAFNEMAYLALPVATVAVLLRARLVLGRPWRDSGVRLLAFLWAGFLPVLLPVRAVVQAHCGDGGCYEGSDAVLADAAVTFPNRLVSWLPPLGWQWAAPDRHDWPAGALPVLAAVLLLIPAWFFVRRSAALDRRQSLALAGVAAAVLVLAAGMASLNVWMQDHAAHGRYGVGWRDSALTTVGGGLLVLALLALLPAFHRWSAVVLIALAGLAGVTATANEAYRDTNSAGRVPYLHNRIAQELADFDPTTAGAARRCLLRAQYLAGTSPANEPRIDRILDAAADRIGDRRFCDRAPAQAGPVPLYRSGP